MILPSTVEARRQAARQLLDGQAGLASSSDELAAAALSLVDMLCQRLSLLVGSSGASALLERAMGEVAVISTPLGPRSRQPRCADLLSQLDTSLRALDVEQGRTAFVALFVEFASILGRFVGDAFATRVLHDLWPQFFPERFASP